MTLPVHLLDRRVVGVLVGHEEGGLDVAAVRVFTLAVKDVLVEADVIVVDSVVEGDRDHLRYVFTREIAGYCRTVLRAEAIGKDAHGGIARWSSVGIVVHVCNVDGIAIVRDIVRDISIRVAAVVTLLNVRSAAVMFRRRQLTANVFVGAVSAVLLSVAEETPLDAGAVSAGQVAVLAERFLRVEQRLGLPLFVLQFAVVNGVFPVAGLLVDVEVQTGRASYRLQAGTRALDHVAAIVTLAGDQPEPFARILVLADLVLEALLLLVFLTLNAARAL